MPRTQPTININCFYCYQRFFGALLAESGKHSSEELIRVQSKLRKDTNFRSLLGAFLAGVVGFRSMKLHSSFRRNGPLIAMWKENPNPVGKRVGWRGTGIGEGFTLGSRDFPNFITLGLAL